MTLVIVVVIGAEEVKVIIHVAYDMTTYLFPAHSHIRVKVDGVDLELISNIIPQQEHDYC